MLRYYVHAIPVLVQGAAMYGLLISIASAMPSFGSEGGPRLVRPHPEVVMIHSDCSAFTSHAAGESPLPFETYCGSIQRLSESLEVHSGARIYAPVAALTEDVVSWSNRSGVFLVSNCSDDVPPEVQYLSCQLLGMEDMEHLRSAHALRALELDVVGNGPRGTLTSAEADLLGGLEQLEDLHVGGLFVTDDGLASIASLQGLRALKFHSHGRYTAEGLKQLAVLPYLESLSLSGAPLEGIGLDVLQDFESLDRLVHLDVGNSGLHGSKDVAVLRKMNSLRYLELSNNPLDAKAIKQVARCSTLTHVRMIHDPTRAAQLVALEPSLQVKID